VEVRVALDARTWPVAIVAAAVLRAAPAFCQEEEAATAPPAASAEEAAPTDAEVVAVSEPPVKKGLPLCAAATSYKECKVLCRAQFLTKIKAAAAKKELDKAKLAVHGWWTLGAGVALLVGGGVTGGVAIHLNKELQGACDGGSCSPAYHADIDTRDRLAVTSTILVAGGVAASAVGVLILAVFARPAKAKADAVAFAPSLGPDAAGATLAWRF
jgi:hypothetical protein